jgi:hypothetical protein
MRNEMKKMMFFNSKTPKKKLSRGDTHKLLQQHQKMLGSPTLEHLVLQLEHLQITTLGLNFGAQKMEEELVLCTLNVREKTKVWRSVLY